MSTDTPKVKVHADGATPYPLAELTQYQSGSIVSRTLLQDESGTLTVFAFDARPSPLGAHRPLQRLYSGTRWGGGNYHRRPTGDGQNRRNRAAARPHLPQGPGRAALQNAAEHV